MAYEIPIDVTKAQAIAKAFNDAAASVDNLDSKIQGLNGTMGQSVTRGGRVVQAAANPSNATPDPSTERAYSAAAQPRGMTSRISSLDPYRRQGVRERLDYETNQLDRARATGDDRLIRDQENRVVSAQKAVDRAERALAGPKSRDEILEDIINTSRIGRNGQIYPLIGKLKQLQSAEGAEAAAATLKGLGIGGAGATAEGIAGLASAALPALIGGGVALAAGAAVFGTAEAGDARMRRSNNAFYALGGSPGNVGAAIALGGENAEAKALALGDRLREGSYGSAFMRSRGIYDMGPYQVDKSSNYVAALDALRTVPDVQQRIRIARDVGLTDDLWTSDLSEGSYRRLKNSRMAAGTPAERRAEAEYRAQKEEIGGYWDTFVRLAGGAGMNALTTGARAARVVTGHGDENDVYDLLNSYGAGYGDVARGTWYGLKKWAAGIYGGRTPVGRYLNGQNGKGSRGFAGWQNIEPPVGKEPVTYNGTTAGAVPVGYRGQAMNADLDRLNQMIGAF